VPIISLSDTAIQKDFDQAKEKCSDSIIRTQSWDKALLPLAAFVSPGVTNEYQTDSPQPLF